MTDNISTNNTMANEFYSQLDFLGKEGKPGQVRSYEIGYINSRESFETYAKEYGVSLEQHMTEYVDELLSETPFTWQTLGSGYRFHGDTIVTVGNVVVKDIFGQIMIDEYETLKGTRYE